MTFPFSFLFNKVLHTFYITDMSLPWIQKNPAEVAEQGVSHFEYNEVLASLLHWQYAKKNQNQLGLFYCE